MTGFSCILRCILFPPGCEKLPHTQGRALMRPCADYTPIASNSTETHHGRPNAHLIMLRPSIAGLLLGKRAPI